MPADKIVPASIFAGSCQMLKSFSSLPELHLCLDAAFMPWWMRYVVKHPLTLYRASPGIGGRGEGSNCGYRTVNGPSRRKRPSGGTCCARSGVYARYHSFLTNLSFF